MKLIIRLFLILLTLTILISGVLWVWKKIAGPADTNEPQQQAEQQDEGRLVKGFVQDTDSDGLSDAKEQIFGSDPNNADTDGDTFRDGHEVENGYDPTTGGSALIKDNPKYKDNLTIQYFEWGSKVLGEKDIKFDDEKVVKFFEALGIAELQLPEVRDEEIKKTPDSSPEALKQYLTSLAAIQLPEETGSFVDLAEDVIQTKKTELLDQVIAGLISVNKQFADLPVPEKALAAHKGYMSMVKVLMNMFTDLYTIERDPVKLMRDMRWGNDLIEHAVEVEKQRAALLNQ